MKRPRVDLDSDLEDDVAEYARENGLTRPRAYRQLIEQGLACDKEDHSARLKHAEQSSRVD